MVKSRPDLDPDKTYGATEAARRLGIHRNTLMRYTQRNEIDCLPIRGSGWFRYYSGAELLRLWERKM